MAADLVLNLSPDSSAPALARAEARRYLAGKIGAEQLSELCIVLSELVSNALVHGRGGIVLRLKLDQETVRGEVIDQGAGFEHEVRERGPQDVSGRGLLLVDALTSRWGVHEGTTHVWFETKPSTDASGRLDPRLGQDERPDALD